MTTPVLIGVLMSWIFTETFGWVFAGLVVPGYLAAVFLVEPAAGIIDVFEAVLTYGVARIIGEHLPRSGVMSRTFGRERFLLLLLVSILVRLGVEGWILPRALPHATWAYSIGLVVVPLAANACWKTGLVRGIIQNGVPTLAVFLLLRHVLVPYTNLSLSGFELATENVAESFLGSPKAYILLVTGALLAAAANVRYGWDFNGILVPALIGLVVMDPLKLVATCAEALILYGIVLGLLRFTPFSRVNIEGPRRTVVFFTMDYALRFSWAAAMVPRLPGGDIVAFTGFGYLLPTLLAVKMSQSGSASLVLLPTLTVSVLGAMLGSLLGFGAGRIDRAPAPAPSAPETSPPAEPLISGPMLAPVLPPIFPPIFPDAAALLAGAIALEGAPEPDATIVGDLSQTRAMLDAASNAFPAQAASAPNMDARPLEGGMLIVRERGGALGARRGAPTYLLRPRLPENPVVILVPAPLASPATAAMAGRLVAWGDADAVVIAGIEEPKVSWLQLETTAHAAARWLATGGTLLTLRDRRDSRMATAKDALPSMPGRVHTAASRIEKSALVSIGGEAVLAIDAGAVARALEPSRSLVPLDSATAMAASLEGVRASSDAGDIEHLIALRRLVLEPLLSADASVAARELVPFAAAALGYRLTAPTPSPLSPPSPQSPLSPLSPLRAETVALLPVERNRPIAVFARTTGVRERVVESPLGVDRGVRDLTLRLGVALGADAIILGEVFDGAMRGGAVRGAHAAATHGRSPSVFIVRKDPTREDATLAAWMDDGRGVATARRALDELGLPITEVPADFALRDLATRTLLQPTPLIAVTAGAMALATTSLDDPRLACKRIPALSARDGTLQQIASSLVESLEANAGDAARALASDDLEEIVRRAAADGSITSARRLVAELETGAIRAVIARVREGTFLVVAARRHPHGLLVTAPISVKARTWHAEHRESLEACAKDPIVVGVCEASQ